MNLKSFFKQLAITTSVAAVERLLTADDSPFVKRPMPAPKVVKKKTRAGNLKPSGS